MLLDRVFPYQDPLGDYPRIAIPFIVVERVITNLAFAARRLPRRARKALVTRLRTYTGASLVPSSLEWASGRPLQGVARWLLEAPRSVPETTAFDIQLRPDDPVARAAYDRAVTRMRAHLDAGEGSCRADRPSRPSKSRTSPDEHRRAAILEAHLRRQARRDDGRTGLCCACGRPLGESGTSYPWHNRPANGEGV